MAFVPRPYWNINFGFRDNNEKVASVSTKVPGALTEAEVTTRVTALAAALQAVSDAAIFTATIEKGFVNDTPPTPPTSSEVERKLNIPLGTALVENATSMEVPSPLFSLEIDGTDIVDQTDPLLVTLLGLLTAGALGPGDGSVTYYGDDITRAGAPVITHRNRRAKR